MDERCSSPPYCERGRARAVVVFSSCRRRSAKDRSGRCIVQPMFAQGRMSLSRFCLQTGLQACHSLSALLGAVHCCCSV